MPVPVQLLQITSSWSVLFQSYIFNNKNKLLFLNGQHNKKTHQMHLGGNGWWSCKISAFWPQNPWFDLWFGWDLNLCTSICWELTCNRLVSHPEGIKDSHPLNTRYVQKCMQLSKLQKLQSSAKTAIITKTANFCKLYQHYKILNLEFSQGLLQKLRRLQTLPKLCKNCKFLQTLQKTAKYSN